MRRSLYLPENRLIEATEENFRQIAQMHTGKEFICPYCHMVDPDADNRVFPRFREGYIPHFVHYRREDNWTCLFDRKNPDTSLHYAGCEYLREVMRSHLGIFFEGELQIEIDQPLFLPNGKKRIADVYCNVGQQYYIYEFQKSPITIAKLNERTSDYLTLSAEVAWYLYGKANTKVNRDWCMENLGCCYEVEAQIDWIYAKQEENF